MIYGEIAADRPLALQNSKIKINCDTSQTLVADSAFYAFFAGRYTFPFRKNVFYEDAVRFDDVLASIRVYGADMVGQRILLRMLDYDEIPHWFFLEINEVDIEKNRTVEFVANNLDTFMDYFGGVEDRSRSLHAILRQFDSIYFEYIPATDAWKMYNICESADIIMIEDTLEKWIEKLIEKKQIENPEEMKELVSYLRTGQDRFIATISSSMLSNEGIPENVVFRGSACYKNGRISKVAGAIYVRRSRGDSVGLDSYDFLTGVLNRRTIIERCEQLMENQPESDLTLCIIDVDFFKEFNDTCGHAFGDEVLKKVALTIRNSVGDRGYVGRIGGDEFLIVLKGIGAGATLRSILTSLRSGVEDIYSGENDRKVTVSIGSASYPANAPNYDKLFKIADFALYLAKEKGRNRYVVYIPERHEKLLQAKEDNAEQVVEDNKKLRFQLLTKIFHETITSNSKVSIDEIMEPIASFFTTDRIAFFKGNNWERCYLYTNSTQANCEYLKNFPMEEELQSLLREKGFFKCGDTSEIKLRFPKFYQANVDLDTVSFIVFVLNLGTPHQILFLLEQNKIRRKYGDEDCAYLTLIFEMLVCKFFPKDFLKSAN